MSKPINERRRFALASAAIAANLTTLGGKTESEILAEQGYEDAREYWATFLSEPWEVPAFAHFLSRHQIDATRSENIELMLIQSALNAAWKAGEPWFFSPRPPPGGDASEMPQMLRPREAVEWMLRMPRHRHLLPAGLVDYLHPIIDLVPVRGQLPPAASTELPIRESISDAELFRWVDEWLSSAGAPSQAAIWTAAKEKFVRKVTRSRVIALFHQRRPELRRRGRR